MDEPAAFQAFAPIAVFAYRRPDHLRNLLSSLEKCPEFKDSPLLIFVDGPKGGKDRAAVEEVRSFAEGYSHPAKRLFISERNKGLARSIIDGVSKTLAEFETVIVLEDDLLASPFLLKYMNDALRLYSDDVEMASIHAYVYPVDEALPESFLLRGADCWGWATWRRAWKVFDEDGARLLRGLSESGLRSRFDFDGAYSFSRMLERQIAGRNDSWAVRWHASAFLAGMFTLYPARPLAINDGCDGSGVHCSPDGGLFSSRLADAPIELKRLPFSEDERAWLLFKRFLESRRLSFARRAWNFLKGRLARCFR